MKPWKTLSKDIIFERKPFFQISQQKIELPNGKVIDDFFQVHLRTFASIVPVMEDGRVLVLRNYKHGPGRVVLSVPAGFIEPGEAPMDGAKRELLEETGMVSDDWTALGTYVDNGNQQGCTGHYFLAKDCRRVQAPDSGDHEEMQIETMSVEELDAALKANEFGVVHQAANWAFARMYL
ncbi:NUDIX hydrolase [Pseudoprimorskyibacter insulae]|uniref:GDP-mannose pyrophosphatase n=1 Tax=Pseudoprimorskyibacter insulae TaxID=1695997 RepID=A0A2R8AVX2_9RHOB|nr:NUDIX hydrolase [Pseudoprimorskyibacter insulae]SPF80166.1 ADP-ribose pyrophosphatase [Pseudoprimorskyibacter insulae]